MSFLRSIRKFGLFEYLKQQYLFGEFKGGSFVGQDKFGNKYFQITEPDAIHCRDRYVEYASRDADPTQIPPDWHMWLHRAVDEPPSLVTYPFPRFYQGHMENLTGSSGRYVPYSTTVPKVEKMYREPGVLFSSLFYIESHSECYNKEYEVVGVLCPNGSTESYPIVRPRKDDEYDPIQDLLDLFSALALQSREIKTLMKGIDEVLTSNNKAAFSKLVEEYNAVMLSKVSKNFIPSDHLIEFLLNQSYLRSIDKPALLNKYKNFSHEVYGEANISFVSLMLSKFSIKNAKKFIDLGSGIGTVVLAVAAKFNMESFGIELRSVPAAYAKALHIEFESRCRCYKKTLPPIHLKQGNFLQDEEMQSYIQSADIVFANNVAFGPELNAKLLDVFVCLKEGAKIISLVNFAPVDQTINQFNAHSPSSILKVEKFEYPPGSMSWTSSGGQFYVHTIDRSRLKEFLAK